jgi:NAD(P)H dehydrogenase (quinone)
LLLLARNAGHEIVGVSRTRENVPSPAQGRHGDYDRPETLLSAYDGLDRLLIIPTPDMSPGARGRQFVAAIDAAVSTGVGHVVLVSSAATRETAETDMYAAYWTGEQHLMKTAPRWTILRMNYYGESFAQMAAMTLETGVMPGLGENRVAFVSRDDLGAASAGILLGKGQAGAIYSATGPAVGGAARAALVAEMTGKPTRYAVLDEAQLRHWISQSGMPAEYVEPLIDIEKTFVSGMLDIVTGDIERLADRPARTLREVLSRQFA